MARANAPEWIAAELLLICAARETLWWFAPPAASGDVSKLLGACMVLVLVDVIRRLADVIGWRSRELSAVLGLTATYQALTMLGMAWFIADPWPVPEGEGVLNALVGFNLGSIWLIAVAALAGRLTFMKGN